MNNWPCAKTIVMVLTTVCVMIAGCGFQPATDFPHAIIGADGRPLVLDDLRAISDDPDRTTDEKRDAFRALGVEDEKLIDALLTL